VRFHPLLNNIEQYPVIGKLLVDRPTVAMDLLPAEDEIWMQQVSSKNRNTIKKATNNGLTFVRDTDFTYLDKFIALYNRTMQKVGADDFYIFENEYYERFRNNVKDSFLGVVLHNDVVVSGAMFFYSKEYGHYHLSGSNPEFLYLNPNNFMLWEAAKALKELGVKYFHLGGGSTGDENNSLLEFKSRFSKNRFTFHIGKTMFDQQVYDALCSEWVKNNNEEKVQALRNHLLKYKY
jgi:lipid II:glycine glycyltransferase (peptidoglycan interpeptide bridge formation enzyme)